MNRPDLEVLRRKMKKSFDFDLSELDLQDPSKSLASEFVKIAKQLLPRAAKMMSINENELERRLTKVSMLMEPEVNCFVRSSDNWETFEIGVNQGLAMFIFKMVKLFTSRIEIGVMGEDGPDWTRVEHTEIPVEETVAIAKRLMRAFWEGNLSHEEGFRLIELNSKQMLITGILLHYAECFAIAHELGHVVINLKLKKAGKLVDPRAEEIVADMLGLQLALELENDEFMKLLIYWAVELFFILWNMLETFYEKFYEKSCLSDTHPSAKVRLAALRSEVSKSNPSLVMQSGQMSEQVADAILAEVAYNGPRKLLDRLLRRRYPYLRNTKK